MVTQLLQGGLNVIGAIGPILLVALALTALLSSTRVLNASVGTMMVFSAFAGIWGAERAGLLGALVSSVGVSIILYLLLELAVLRPQRRRLANVEMGSFAATLGVATILLAVGVMVTNGDSVTLPADSLRVDGVFRVGDAAMPWLSLVQFGCSVALALLLAFVLHRTGFGRQFRALADNRPLAAAIGIDVDRMALLSAGMGGILTGVAALLTLVEIRSLDVTSASDFLLIPFAAVVAGGLGSLRGTVIACCFFGLAQTVAITTIGTPGIQDIFVFGLLFIVLYIRPQGFQSARARD